MSRAAIFLLRAYQRLVSPLLGPRCKYAPTCSEYAVQAIGACGMLRGLALAGWRVLRCNPWSHGGHDPVEARPHFRPKRRRRPAPAPIS